MSRMLHRLLAAALVALSASCAHGPAPRDRAALGEIVWPAPPARPRVRLLAIHPDPAAPVPRRAWWRVALELITGARSDEERLLLVRPFGVAFAADGTLFAADPDAARVVRIDARGTLTDVSCKDARWGAPMALAVDGDGSLLVADAGAHEVVRWSEGGCRTLAAGLLERPTGIAVAAARIWVADPPRHEVVALSPMGEVLLRVGAIGEGNGRLHFPTAVAVAPDGEVLVVDALNFRIARFGGDGAWHGAFGGEGDQAGEFARPKGIAVGAAGEIYVSDAQRDAVLVFAPDGTFEYELGETGTAPGQLTHPAGVAVSGGLIAVADSQNHRIQVLAQLGGAP